MAFLLLSLEREGVGELFVVHVHVGFASLYSGLLHVSVFFLRYIICHLILTCDPLDSLYLYLLPRFLDFSANPFPLVRGLRLVPSLSLGKENYGSLLHLDQNLGADQPWAEGLGSLVRIH